MEEAAAGAEVMTAIGEVEEAPEEAPGVEEALHGEEALAPEVEEALAPEEHPRNPFGPRLFLEKRIYGYSVGCLSEWPYNVTIHVIFTKVLMPIY